MRPSAAPRSAAPGSPVAAVAPPPRPAGVCVVGPMVGRNPGRVTTQGEILSDLLAAAGHHVVSVSSAANRYVRLADIAATMIRCRARVDTVIVQLYSGPSFVVADLATTLARRHGHHLVLHLHGGALPEFFARHPRWARRVLGRADAFVAPSPYLADAVRTLGFSPHVIPNVVDLAACPYRRRTVARPRFFWMRSFHPLYNPTLALDVLARVRTVLPDATLTMAGQDKGQLAALRADADRRGLGGAVRFVGFLDAAGKAREGLAADVFLNTSRVDNTPVAVVEACAMGLPVVSTDVGGVRHLLTHEETGLLVPDDDAAAMTVAALRLCSERALVERLSVNGRRLAEAAAPERARASWEALLGELRATTARPVARAG